MAAGEKAIEEATDKTLDACSEDFDPLKALSVDESQIVLPCPEVPPCYSLIHYQEIMRRQKRLEHKKKPAVESMEPKPRPRAVEHVKSILTFMPEQTQGPLSVLRRAMSTKETLNVWVRHSAGLRGVCTGKIRAFDRHWNIVMYEVTECYTPIKTISNGGRERKVRRRVRKRKNAAKTIEDPTNEEDKDLSTSTNNNKRFESNNSSIEHQISSELSGQQESVSSQVESKFESISSERESRSCGESRSKDELKHQSDLSTRVLRPRHKPATNRFILGSTSSNSEAKSGHKSASNDRKLRSQPASSSGNHETQHQSIPYEHKSRSERDHDLRQTSSHHKSKMRSDHESRSRNNSVSSRESRSRDDHKARHRSSHKSRSKSDHESSSRDSSVSRRESRSRHKSATNQTEYRKLSMHLKDQLKSNKQTSLSHVSTRVNIDSSDQSSMVQSSTITTLKKHQSRLLSLSENQDSVTRDHVARDKRPAELCNIHTSSDEVATRSFSSDNTGSVFNTTCWENVRRVKQLFIRGDNIIMITTSK